MVSCVANQSVQSYYAQSHWLIIICYIIIHNVSYHRSASTACSHSFSWFFSGAGCRPWRELCTTHKSWTWGRLEWAWELNLIRAGWNTSSGLSMPCINLIYYGSKLDFLYEISLSISKPCFFSIISFDWNHISYKQRYVSANPSRVSALFVWANEPIASLGYDAGDQMAIVEWLWQRRTSTVGRRLGQQGPKYKTFCACAFPTQWHHRK